MNIAIIIKARNPKEGGGYTITNDIFEEIISNKKNYSKYNIYFVIVNDIKKKYTKLLKKNNFNYITIKEYFFFSKIKIFLFCKFRFLLKFYNFLKLNSIENYIIKNKIDIVWPISSEFKYPYSKPYFFTVWDLQHKTIPQFNEVGSFFVRYFRDTVLNINLKTAKFVITGTKVGKNEIIKYYKINKKKIYINSHPTPKWSLVNKNIKNKIFLKNLKIKKYFLYPANFWSHKNHINLLKGFYYFLKKRGNNYNLVLVGNIIDKKVYKNIKDYIIEKKINNNVRILGFVNRNQLMTLYDNSLALAYLSTSGPENLPPLETLARGKPVVNSLFPGAKEQLINNAIYVDPYNPYNIAKGLEDVLKIKNKTKKFKKFAQTKKTKNYIKKIFYIIDNTINKKNEDF